MWRVRIGNFDCFWPKHQIAHQSIASSSHCELCIKCPVCSLHHFCTMHQKRVAIVYLYTEHRTLRYTNGDTTMQSPDFVRWEAKYIAKCSFPVSGSLFSLHFVLFLFHISFRLDFLIVGSKFYTCSTDQVHGKKKKTNICILYTIKHILISIQLKMPNIFFFRRHKEDQKEFWENFISIFHDYFDICHTQTFDILLEDGKKQSAHDQPENKLNSSFG